MKAKLISFIGALLIVLAMVGCTGPTIIVPAGEPIQIAEPVEAKAYVTDEEGKLQKRIVEIPEGWWALPDPGPSGDE